MPITEQTPLTSFQIGTNDPMITPIFLGENGCAGVARTDMIRYPIFQKQADRMFEAIWKKTEINITQDRRNYMELDTHEQGIWRDTLKSQIAMDSEQGASIVQAFMPITTDPMVKRCLNYIEFFEEVHSDTYEHIVKNVIDPKLIYDGMGDLEHILVRTRAVSIYYDNLLDEIARYRLGLSDKQSVRKHAWLALQAMNALEGIRFFVSFACSFAFGETGRMMGNAALISLIANDELMHVAFTTALLRLLPREDEHFARIKEECAEESKSIFMEVYAQEVEVARYTFRNGSMLGFNEHYALTYLTQRTAKCMKAVEMEFPYAVPTENNLPWMGKWLNDGDNQPAPQEKEVTSYVHAVTSDIDEDTFSDMEL